MNFRDLHRDIIAEARASFLSFAQFMIRGRADNNQRRWSELLDAHPRLVVFTHRYSGSTQWLSVLRPIWELGHNPALRFLIIADDKRRANIRLDLLHDAINHDRVREVFPELRIKSASATGDLTVHRPSVLKDPSIRVTHAFGSVTSGRADRIVMETHPSADRFVGVEDIELMRWYDACVESRNVKGSRVWVYGSPHDPKDFLHILASRDWWTFARTAVRPRDSFGWSDEAILRALSDYGPTEFARQLLGVVGPELVEGGRVEDEGPRDTLGRDNPLSYAVTAATRFAPPKGGTK